MCVAQSLCNCLFIVVPSNFIGRNSSHIFQFPFVYEHDYSHESNIRTVKNKITIRERKKKIQIKMK